MKSSRAFLTSIMVGDVSKKSCGGVVTVFADQPGFEPFSEGGVVYRSDSNVLLIDGRDNIIGPNKRVTYAWQSIIRDVILEKFVQLTKEFGARILILIDDPNYADIILRMPESLINRFCIPTSSRDIEPSDKRIYNGTLTSFLRDIDELSANCEAFSTFYARQTKLYHALGRLVLKANGEAPVDDPRHWIFYLMDACYNECATQLMNAFDKEDLTKEDVVAFARAAINF